MPTPDAFDPNAPAVPDELREKLFTKPSHALGEPTKALGNALRDNATLRARIAELEARLSLAEAVCKEADKAPCRHSNDHTELGCEVCDALAAWREGK